MAIADFGVMEICCGFGSFSPLSERRMACLSRENRFLTLARAGFVSPTTSDGRINSQRQGGAAQIDLHYYLTSQRRPG